MASFRGGSGDYQFLSNVTLNPANVTASSISSETFTITGINTDTMYVVDAPSLEAGLFLLGAVPTAVNTLRLDILNTTLADINPASQVFRIIGL